MEVREVWKWPRWLKGTTTCPRALVSEVKVMHKEQALFEGLTHE